MTQIAVVGGGVSGLVAARELWRHGFEVTLFEATDRLGGQIRTEQIAGLPVDVGAEALHVAGPVMAALRDELALGDREVTARPGSAWIWSGRRLRRLPAGVGPAGPTRLRPVISAGVLSPLGLARAALEPFLPRGTVPDDEAVGHYLARRFGRQVTDRLLDPVLGSLHAGDVWRLSMAATTPYLAAQATRERSLLIGSWRAGRRTAPSFLSYTGGLQTFTDALVADTDVQAHVGTTVSSLTSVAGGYRLGLEGDHPRLATDTVFDGVVLATPAPVAAQILHAAAPAASTGLDELLSASVATVVLAFRRNDLEERRAFRATGLLVPSSAGRALKAATFLSTKWPHLAGDDLTLVRLSAGRARSALLAELDDDQLVQRLREDLADATGLRAAPLIAQVQRWPGALPQLEVGHLERMARIRAGLAHLPTVALAGAPYDGLGITSCVGSGTRAALDIADQVATRAGAVA